MKFEDIVKKVDKKELEKLYLYDLLSLEEISKRLNICNSSVKKLLVYYNLTRNTSKVQSQAQSNKNTKLKQLQITLTRDIIYNWYIVEDNSYKDAPKYFNISQYQFDNLCREYNIKKDKSLVNKKKLNNKYLEYGNEENYKKHLQEKTRNTHIEKYGSEENYIKHLREKCTKSWANKTGKEMRQHAETISIAKRSLPENAVNEAKIKRRKTLNLKYGVNNSYALATFKSSSNPNKLFEKKLQEHNIFNYSKEFILKDTDKFYRYDFKVDNNLIEINPWPFHNSTFNPIFGNKPLDKNYHKQKSDLAKNNNYRCIHVFDWDDQEKIIDLLIPKYRIGASKCKIKEVSIDECDKFLNKYHLQNTCRKQLVRLGLYYKDELLEIMTFGKPRYNKKYEWELLRLCAYKDYIIYGGSERLFKYFIKNYKPSSIISYCDLSKFTGDVYTKLGFKLKSISKPTIHWYNTKTGQHITDNLLRQKGFDKLFNTDYGKGTDNSKLMKEYNFVEIYDCGQASFVYEI
ncbi:MAG: hypothetical protein ACI3T9_05010 [Romboutsia timonensis]